MIIGVTGIIGSGKSTAAQLLAERLSAEIIDVDKVGHQVLAQNKFARFILGLIFGSVERKDIARQVFNSPRKLFILNSVLHPFMRREIRKQIRSTDKSLILSAALLFQMRLHKYCEQIIFVTAPENLIYERLRAKGFTTEQIRQRLTANQEVYRYQKLATRTLSNATSEADLRRNIAGIFPAI